MMIVFTFVFVACAIQSCKNGTVEPPPPKNPRTYSWSVDTIGSPTTQTLLNELWGSSPRDIYAVGSGGMFHYDGTGWSVVVPLPGQFVEFQDIFGFSADEVWAAGGWIYPNPNPPPNFLDSSLIMHYDGTRWRIAQSGGAREIRSLWGTSPSNLYAGSLDGRILHYDGSRWSIEHLHNEMQIISLGGDGSTLFAGGGVTISFPDTQMIYANSGTGWYLVDQQLEGEDFSNPRFGYSAIFSPAPGIIYSSTWGIFKWENNTWSRIMQSANALVDIAASSQDNIFVVGSASTVWHWNGRDWQRIPIEIQGLPQYVNLFGIWVNETEVFIAGDDGFHGYVLHGK